MMSAASKSYYSRGRGQLAPQTILSSTPSFARLCVELPVERGRKEPSLQWTVRIKEARLSQFHKKVSHEAFTRHAGVRRLLSGSVPLYRPVALSGTKQNPHAEGRWRPRRLRGRNSRRPRPLAVPGPGGSLH